MDAPRRSRRKMEALVAQVRSLKEEMETITNEIVKASTDAHSTTTRTLTDHGIRIGGIEGKLADVTKKAESFTGSGKQKSLIDIKNIVVGQFAGSLTDGRAKYLEWCEKVRDRCELYDRSLTKALAEVAGKAEEVTEEESRKLGVDSQASAELQGFLKEHTQGTAASIVRNNIKGVGLES